ncbi:MAG: YjgN family protein [Emticicia sp.]
MTENLPDETSLAAAADDSQAAQPIENNTSFEPSTLTATPIEENTQEAQPPIEPPTVAPITTKPIYHAPWRLSFHGEGSKYFVIRLINAILQVVTFNFYYPWAKAAKLDYLYEQTEFAGSRFKFHGTGKEMFIGYLKMLLIVAVIYGGFYWSTANQQAVLGFLILYGGLILVYPLAIHGTAKYRLSRTSWRGIFFGYRGELGELFAKFFIGILISLFTLGIYWSWVEVDLRKYVTKNIRFGSVEFDFVGKGIDLFLIKLKYVIFAFVAIIFGVVLVVMFGVVSGSEFSKIGIQSLNPSIGFIFFGIIAYLLLIAIIGSIALMRQREIFQYYADNTFLWQNEQWHGVKLNMSFMDLLVLSITNMLLIIFTFGIATPFVEIRTLHFIMPRLEIAGSFDPDSLTQTESDYRDAMGEDVGDWLDIDLA